MDEYINQDDQSEASMGNQVLLSKIDHLRELNIGSIVPLPQLVVVGDQSSGKSSVLESITGFSFPRATNLCTRYATQITCERDSSKSVDISILPGPHASPSHTTVLETFHSRATKVSRKELADIFAKANTAMGIRTSTVNNDDQSLPTFSEDVLKIVIKGPAESHLTVIDVPGIFRSATEGVTTENDIVMVRNMVKTYMKNPRTIILAVMPSNVDPATQEILTLAKEVDSDMRRTLGVLTKPDLALERATQDDAITLVNGQNRINSQGLGYCIVRNRGPDDETLTLEDLRQKEEALFGQDPWNQLLSSGRMGIASLKSRLRELLMDISKKEFPAVKDEIRTRLARNRQKLETMGESRAETHAQRIYLGNMSGRFQRITKHALDAYYTHDNILNDHDEMRLITRSLELNDDFCEVLNARGHTRNFTEVCPKEVPVYRKTEFCHSHQSREKEFAMGINGSRVKELAMGINGNKVKELPTDEDGSDEFSEIRDILGDDSYDCPEPLGDSLLDHIEDQYRNARGRELGTVPATLLGTTFKGQTAKWQPLVISHVSKTICLVHNFIRKLMEYTCPEDDVRSELWDSALLDDLRACYTKAMDHTHFLLEVEREIRPMTLNDSFSSNVEKSRADRQRECVESAMNGTDDGLDDEQHDESHDQFTYGLFDPIQPVPRKKLMSRKRVRALQFEKTILEHSRDEVYDALKAYYEVSRKRFVDVVCQQVVNYFLLGSKGPLAVFCNERVNKMSINQLEMIASEDSETKRLRTQLLTETLRLNQAMEVLRR